MKKVSLFIVTDGRYELLEKTMKSLNEKVKYDFFEKLIFNDCIDNVFIDKVHLLAGEYGFTVYNHLEKKGFAGVYNTAWETVSKEADFVFSCEDDFTFEEEINIPQMIMILEKDRNIVQVCLKRQAWNEQEKKAGGIIEQWPELYDEKHLGNISWTEHRLFYSTNPCLTPSWVIKIGWPLTQQSESLFSKVLFSNPNFKSSYLGKKFDAPKVIHHGFHRMGINY